MYTTLKSKNPPLLPVIAIAAFAACAGMDNSRATIIMFDDLPTPNPNGSSVVPNGYGGLNWQNFDYLGGATATVNPSGYQYADVSPANEAFNGEGKPATITSATAFDLNSAYLTGAWRDGLQVEVEGYVGTTLTYNTTYTVISTAPTLIDFNYLGVDKVVFTTSGGTLNPNYHDPEVQAGADEFAMDNLTINATPEPTTLALAGAGAAFALAWRRRRVPRA